MIDYIELGKVAKIDRSAASTKECADLPYIGLEHIEKDTGHFAAGYEPRPEALLATKFRFTPKHVLYGKLRPYLNKVLLPSFDGVCTTEILPILPNEQKLDRAYLWAYLLSPEFVSWASESVSGANLPRIDPKLLVDRPIPLPPLAEQRRIAAILARADRLRRLRRYALELSAGYLQAVFVEMFGDPVTNPKGWEVEQLRDISLKFSDGPFGSNLKSEHYVTNGIRVIRLQNIGVGELIDADKAYICESHFATLEKHRCIPGDVLVGTLGDPNLRAMILPKAIPVALNKADCVQIRVDPRKAHRQFVCWLLNLPHTLYMATQMIHGQTRERISMGQLAELRAPIPPVLLQEKFALVAEHYERLRGRQREALRQAEQLFGALLVKAFRGELGEAASASGRELCKADL